METIDNLYNEIRNSVQEVYKNEGVFRNTPFDTLILSKTRKREVVEARSMMYHLAKAKGISDSLSFIGERLGNTNDHSNVIHGITNMNNLLSSNNKPIVDKYNKCIALLKNAENRDAKLYALELINSYNYIEATILQNEGNRMAQAKGLLHRNTISDIALNTIKVMLKDLPYPDSKWYNKQKLFLESVINELNKIKNGNQ